MKLLSFTVNNFRSITSANKIPFQDMTILAGKNNEGKSNLLMAISVAMNTLRYYSDSTSFLRKVRQLYDWQRDYPVSEQTSKKKNKESEFVLEFVLTQEEVIEFQARYKHKLNGSLPVKVSFDSSNNPQIKVVKRGKGSKSLNAKSRYICSYIAHKIEFNYIPAVRTKDAAMREINKQVANALCQIESDKKYKEAIKVIQDLRRPILASIETQVCDTLKEFLPLVVDVSINLNDEIFVEHSRYASIKINDGQLTDLQNKGDGVKSLVALALLKNLHINEGGISIIAVEEPEAHLHPEAINILRDTIYSLSSKSQVIISTHNPLFVNRCNLSSNIIVKNGVVSPAANIREIREILGVKISDNLFDSEVMLLVEGDTDKISLSKLLSTDPAIKLALDTNRFSILTLGGTGAVSYYINLLNTLISSTLVFLDSDEAGRNAINKALGDKIIDDKHYYLCKKSDMAKSEFEDIISLDLYRQEVIDKYGVDLDTGKMRNKTKVWSDRVRDVFEDNGKVWTEELETDLKYLVAHKVEDKPEAALIPGEEVILNNLRTSIKKALHV